MKRRERVRQRANESVMAWKLAGRVSESNHIRKESPGARKIQRMRREKKRKVAARFRRRHGKGDSTRR